MDITPLIGVIGGLVVLWLVLIAILWVLRPRGVPARELLRIVPDLVRLARSLLTDGSVPLDVRLAVAGALLWVVSPLDPVPEVIPLIGQLDDVIIVLVVLRYVRRRLGRDELRRRWPGSDEGFAVLVTVMG